jgi:hypothetical protein
MPIAFLGGAPPPTLFYDICISLGLPGLGVNEGCVFDVADTRSTNGTSQTWTDVVGTMNLTRGSGTGSDAADPTFNGTAGIADENTYWSFDGGDYFQDNSTASDFLDAWNKNNGEGTVVLFMRTVAGANQVMIDMDNASPSFQDFYFQGAGGMTYRHCWNDIGGVDTDNSTGLTISNSAHHMVAVSLEEATNNIEFYVDNAAPDTASSYQGSSRTSNRAGNSVTVGSNLSSSFASGTRLFGLIIASQFWTEAQMDSLYTAVKLKRMPSLP